MSINTKNLDELVIRKTLKEMGSKFNSESAVQLLLMTCATESKMGSYLKQGLHKIDDARALARGIYQMEPTTYADVYDRFIWKNVSPYIKNYVCVNPDVDNLIYDLKYATVLARAKYWLVTRELPSATDVESLATYYAIHWYGGNKFADRKNKAIVAYNNYCR